MNLNKLLELTSSELLGQVTSLLDSIIDKDLINVDLSSAITQLNLVSKTYGTDYNGMIGSLIDQGVIVQGQTASGLRTVGSAISTTSPSRNGVNQGITSSAGTSSTITSGAQPGRTTGTRVYCANPDPSKVPKQNIIDALDQMCVQLDIYVQITPEGGWTGRASGTQNHPQGDAADFQIKQNDGLIFPKTHPEIYGKVVAALKNNANSRGVRPGVGGYPRFIHYDESPWRQSQYPTSKVGFWNSGFNVGSYVA